MLDRAERVEVYARMAEEGRELFAATHLRLADFPPELRALVAAERADLVPARAAHQVAWKRYLTG